MNCLLVGAEKKCTSITPIHCRKELTRISAFIGVSLATTKCCLQFGGSIRRLFPIAARTSANRAVASLGAAAPAAWRYSPRSFVPSRVRARSPVGQPIAFLSNREFLLASFANWLGGWSNVMAHDFIDRLAGRTEIEKVVHCSRNMTSALASRLWPKTAHDQQ